MTAFALVMTALRLLLLSLVLAASLSPLGDGNARAQTSASDQEARHLFEAGQTAFDNGEFERALNYFEDAYRLSQRPQLLYNIGVAADRLRHDARALEAFRQYLHELPRTPNRREVEGRIRILESNAANASTPTVPSTTTTTPGTTVAATPTVEPTPPTESAPTGTEPTSDAAPTATDTAVNANRTSNALFIGAGAAGAVSVLGIAYWANRNGYVQDCRDAVATGRTCSNLSALEGQRTLGFVTASVGLAATAGLIVGALVTRDHGDEPTEGVSVSCAPGGLSLVCSGRF